MIGPASTMPAPPPIPRIEEIIAMPNATRSGGNSSLMMPNASGNTAPARPWTTRPAIITPIVWASADITVPTASVRHRDHQHALLAIDVAHPAEDGRCHRGAQQVRGEDPGRPGRA